MSTKSKRKLWFRSSRRRQREAEEEKRAASKAAAAQVLKDVEERKARDASIQKQREKAKLKKSWLAKTKLFKDMIQSSFVIVDQEWIAFDSFETGDVCGTGGL